MHSALIELFVKLHFSAQFSAVLASAVITVGILIVALISNFFASRIIVKLISRIASKTRYTWDDAIVRRNVLNRLSRVVPALIIYFAIVLAFPGDGFTGLVNFVQRVVASYMIVVVISVFDALLTVVNDIYRTYEIAKSKPITGYLQVIKILLVVIGVGLVITTMLNQSPLALLSGIGALSAVIMLVFKDSILGFVASIQLSANNLVQIGDWIEMPQYNADGDVIDVTLQTIKVQNFDKTITTIPIYSLISGSFKNWRGMSESGGRRIKRSISIDMNSIRFCTEEMLVKFKKFKHVKEYLKRKEEETQQFNKNIDVDEAFLVNSRQLTNIGTFRAYLEGYLKANKHISKTMTFLVRQLPSGPKGLPIEIYVFSSDTVWTNYEAIQADIFDHILAVLPYFDLQVFQEPTGADFSGLAR